MSTCQFVLDDDTTCDRSIRDGHVLCRQHIRALREDDSQDYVQPRTRLRFGRWVPFLILPWFMLFATANMQMAGYTFFIMPMLSLGWIFGFGESKHSGGGAIARSGGLQQQQSSPGEWAPGKQWSRSDDPRYPSGYWT
jgi:hypothetical protein